MIRFLLINDPLANPLPEDQVNDNIYPQHNYTKTDLHPPGQCCRIENWCYIVLHEPGLVSCTPPLVRNMFSSGVKGQTQPINSIAAAQRTAGI